MVVAWKDRDNKVRSARRNKIVEGQNRSSGKQINGKDDTTQYKVLKKARKKTSLILVHCRKF